MARVSECEAWKERCWAEEKRAREMQLHTRYLRLNGAPSSSESLCTSSDSMRSRAGRSLSGGPSDLSLSASGVPSLLLRKRLEKVERRLRRERLTREAVQAELRELKFLVNACCTTAAGAVPPLPPQPAPSVPRPPKAQGSAPRRRQLYSSSGSGSSFTSSTIQGSRASSGPSA
ncbi:hypothetical protein DIPPA_34928 [Diplonema papillatum]|nr:hypothetical protein DIPPA_34928 [Diplonema papillatum]